MSIDGVGKPGGSLPPAGPGNAGPTTGSQRGDTFSVSASTAAERAAGAERVIGTDPLDQVRRGELGIDEYLDHRLFIATRHLEGKLPSEQLEFVRQTLREQLHTDPVLVELVRRTTGNSPGGASR